MIRIIVLFTCLLLPNLAHANFAWPPLFYAHTYTIWWVVLAGFTIEAIVYYSYIERNIKKVLKQTTKICKLCKERTKVKAVLRSDKKQISRYAKICLTRAKLLKNANQRDVYNKWQISKLRAKLLDSQLEISQLKDDLNATAVENSSLKNRLVELENENV